MKIQALFVLLGSVAAGSILLPVAGDNQTGTPTPGPPGTGGEAISVETCADCHEDRAEAFESNPHWTLDRDGGAAGVGASSSCIACHGDPTVHLEEAGGLGNVFAFGEGDSATAKVDACLSCHGDAHPRFSATPHAAAGLDCTSCHSVHAMDSGGERWSLIGSSGSESTGRRNVGSTTATCVECHGEVLAQFEFNERHRLHEGTLDCATCHDPHAPQTRTLLGGFKQEACITCHTDKGGPFVFEHGSVKVEGCTACHEPHGSPNRHQLTFQSVAELCFGCHAAVPGFHSRFTLDSQCTNCHSAIHGSNFDPAFLK